MPRSRVVSLLSFAVAVAALSWAAAPGVGAQARRGRQTTSQEIVQTGRQESHKSAYQRRREANERLNAWLEGRAPRQLPEAPDRAGARAANVQPPVGINPAVDVNFNHFAYSPNIRKFVDSLPGLAINPAPGDPNVNLLGQYIPVAVPDTITYPGSDYYEIGLVEYQEKMHSDLPPTLLRGYVQLNGGDPNPHYLGPIILAQKGRPVRVKFTNFLPTGAGGDLFLPVDTTVMGAGMGPLDMPGMPGMKEMYTQNRATLHLHGGFSPWISDGTPHQWTVPAGEVTQYPKGVSVANVPDMPEPGPGSLTFYWTNQQSARLMFYHDHSYGITRLNVYGGEAAGYLITDPVEESLINGGTLPNLGGLYRYGIPLVIQDKTFVNDATTPPGAGFPAGYTPTGLTADLDPLWYTHIPASQGGDLWFPHEYIPNENLYDPTGFWYQGRWDYGPWIMPPMFPLNDTLPSPSHVPEAFMDTMVVNGTAFPYVELPPTAVRLRILNACNDRMLNLQLHRADPAGFAVSDGLGGSWGTEVKMVPAGPTPGFPASWPVDGRDGGVPDPALAGPDFLQIGNEGGFLAQLAVVPPQPVNFDYDRTSATFGNVSDVGLFLPPAVRADVVVDLSGYQDGDTLILYNDAPAPMSLFDARYDVFTDSQDWTPKGGAPPSAPGFGPNTRTILQIRIKGTPSAPYNVAALQTALPAAFAAAQPAPLVPAAAYNAAYGTGNNNVYANVADETLNVTGSVQPVARVMLELPGFGYTSPPTVKFYGGGGTGAAATASLNGVTGINLLTAGTGYTSPPTVTITGGGGAGATAAAIVSGGVVTAVVITNPGSNYTTIPTVTLSGGGGTGATAQANITLGSVGAITVTNPGSGYYKAPYVTLTGGGGTGAVALAMLNGDLPLDGKNILEGMDMDYGRMNAVLGSTPNPLTPTVGAGPVIGAAFYVDPPTEILNPDETRLWRLMHLGVDSHSLHFHLFDVQVINRVDWTNTLLDPYPEEIGWKETIRTNPFEDIILALRPKASAMKLPFGLPDSSRPLNPTVPLGSTMGFTPVLPPPGVPGVAQLSNVVTNFFWEYVWHCHLLGHEENDMMRPLALKVPSILPTAPVLSGSASGGLVNLSWTDPTPYNYSTGLPTSTLGNPRNEIGFRIERAPVVGGVVGAYVPIGTALANRTTFSAPTAAGTYRYRVVVYNAAGSVNSNGLTIGGTAGAPAAPSNLAVTAAYYNLLYARTTITWTDNSGNETGFRVQRATNPTFTTDLVTVLKGANVTTYQQYVAHGTTYYYRVQAYNGSGNSAWSNVASVTTP
ncbi:MAG: hypothetical protein ACE149_00385 [Armatimonadota bacterium]